VCKTARTCRPNQHFNASDCSCRCNDVIACTSGKIFNGDTCEVSKKSRPNGKITQFNFPVPVREQRQRQLRPKVAVFRVERQRLQVSPRPPKPMKISLIFSVLHFQLRLVPEPRHESSRMHRTRQLQLGRVVVFVHLLRPPVSIRERLQCQRTVVRLEWHQLPVHILPQPGNPQG
jgi:hypothetical protein